MRNGINFLYKISPTLVKSGQISDDVILRKANAVTAMLSGMSSLALVTSAATFIHHNYITEVDYLNLDNIDLSEVTHASSLADVTVTNWVRITNVTGTIAPIISRIKCRVLCISQMRFNTEDTAALVQTMQNSVERLQLGEGVELDTDGRGHCEQTGERYGHQLATWGETMGWSVKKYSDCVLIQRK